MRFDIVIQLIADGRQEWRITVERSRRVREVAVDEELPKIVEVF